MTKTVMMFGVRKTNGVAPIIMERAEAISARVFAVPQAAQLLSRKLIESLAPERNPDELLAACERKAKQKIGQQKEAAVREYTDTVLLVRIQSVVRDIAGTVLYQTAIKEFERHANKEKLAEILFNHSVPREERIRNIDELVANAVEEISGDATRKSALDYAKRMLNGERLLVEAMAKYESALENARNDLVNEMVEMINERVMSRLNEIFMSGSPIGDRIMPIAMTELNAIDIAEHIVDKICPAVPTVETVMSRAAEPDLGNKLAMRFIRANLSGSQLLARLKDMFSGWINYATPENSGTLEKITRDVAFALKTMDEELKSMNADARNADVCEKVWCAYIATIMFKLKLQLKFGLEDNAAFANELVRNIALGGVFDGKEFLNRAGLITAEIFGYDGTGKSETERAETAMKIYGEREKEVTRLARIAAEMIKIMGHIESMSQKSDEPIIAELLKERCKYLRGNIERYSKDIANVITALQEKKR